MEEQQLGPWCYTDDPEVRWELCEICTQPERLLRAVTAPHQHAPVPGWLGPLFFAFSLVCLAAVLVIGAVRHFEIDVSKYFDVFGQDTAGRVVRMARPRPRTPAPGAAAGGTGVAGSTSLGSCGGVAPLVAPASDSADRAQDATFGTLASLASLQQQRNAAGDRLAPVNPMAPGGAERRRAAGQSLLANDSASVAGSVLAAPPIVLGPDDTIHPPNEPRDTNDV